MAGLLHKFGRWRHGRGFGVHSPLAYDMIMSTLNGRYGYYGDALVDKIFDTERDRKRGRVLLRIVARFNPATIAVDNALERCWGDIARNTSTRAAVAGMDDEADLYITANAGFEPPVAQPCVVVYMCTPGRECRRDDADSDVARRLGPVVIDNERDMAVAVRRPGLSATTIYATF